MVSRQQTSRLMSRLLPLLLLELLLVVEEVLLVDAMMCVPGVTLDPTNGLLLALVSLQWTKLTKAEMKLGFCSENSPTPGAAATTPLTSTILSTYLLMVSTGFLSTYLYPSPEDTVSTYLYISTHCVVVVLVFLSVVRTMG